MRLFLYYLYFSDEKLKEFIRNNSNNENWPKANTYYDTLKKWNETFEYQQDIVRQYVEHIKGRKKSDDSFLIQIKNAISGRIKIMKDPDFKHLDQYKIIEITPKMRAEELSNLREAHNIYKRLKEFSGNWANVVRTERIAMQETFNEFWDWNNARDYPITKINELLDEWSLNIDRKDEEFAHIKELKTFEVEMKERTKDTITFIWNVAEIDVPIWKETVDGWKIDGYFKRLVVPAISNNFLFMYNGQYYEVLDWEQTNYNTVEVIAQLSIFWNFYQHVIKASANGILHHSPQARSEICSCPEFDRATNFYDYASKYKLELALYKTEIKGMMKGQTIIYGGLTDENPDALPFIYGIYLERVGRTKTEIEAELKKVNWSKFWNDTWNCLSGISIAGFSLGMGDNELGVMYYLLNNKLEREQSYFECQDHKWGEITHDKNKGKYAIDEKSGIETMLHKWGLTDKKGNAVPFMRHFLQWHVHADLFWRKKEIWKGRYWMLHEQSVGQGLRINETTNASGITITVISPNIVLARMTENITAKLGLSNNGSALLNVAADASLKDDKGQNQRNTERKTVSDTKTDKGTKHSETITKTTSPISGGNSKPRISVPSVQPFLFGSDHTKSEYTFMQFESRWLISGTHPLTMRISFNKDLLNQYKNRKELKGFPAYDYFNAQQFGDLLNSAGFFQASIISWNVVPYADWFREKIEAGINIYNEKPDEFYERKISSPLSLASKGGIIRGTFNIFTSKDNLARSTGRDNLVHVDGRSWVWKTSFCQIQDMPATNCFPELMNQMSHNLQQSTPWQAPDDCWAFNGSASGIARKKLPTLPEGQWYQWWLVAFSKEESDAQPRGLQFRCADEKGLEVVVRHNQADWSLEIIGKVEYRKGHGDPEGIPPAGEPSADPLDPAGGKPEPFNPATPMPAQTLTEPDPVGGGLGGDPELEPLEPEEEVEPEPPEPEKEPEPEPEPDKEPEREPEPEKPDDEQEFS